MKAKYCIYFFILSMFIVSCQGLEYDKEYSSVYPISGDWTIKVNDGTTTSGPYLIKIYNSSFSKDSLWIDDNGAFWQFKAKAKADMKNLTFAAANSQNYTYDSKVTFQNGKVIKNDSIYFEAVFDDGGSTVYKFSGHRKVSYEEYNTH
ncbi:MAG: lipid-binding protein [Bacteroidota bacterium]|nr:lipid-binding protein [Bacteroidota bacterium]